MNKADVGHHLSQLWAVVLYVSQHDEQAGDREKAQVAVNELLKIATGDSYLEKRVRWLGEIVTSTPLFRPPMPLTRSKRRKVQPTGYEAILREIESLQLLCRD